MKQKHANRKFSGFLDSGTSFTGDLQFEGTLRVDGNLSGSVTTPDVLIVGPSARVRADITAGAVQVHGRIIGDVSCSSRIEICPGGHLEGNIQTPRLIIEEGGTFEGQSHTTDESQSTEVDPAAPKRILEVPEPGKILGDEATAGEAEAPRENLTRWKILGKQLEALRSSTSSNDSGSQE